MNEWIGLYEQTKKEGFNCTDAFIITVRAMASADEEKHLKALVNHHKTDSHKTLMKNVRRAIDDAKEIS